jgi:hypothetical protein
MPIRIAGPPVLFLSFARESPDRVQGDLAPEPEQGNAYGTPEGSRGLQVDGEVEAEEEEEKEDEERDG